jgi:hypothetical protein
MNYNQPSINYQIYPYNDKILLDNLNGKIDSIVIIPPNSPSPLVMNKVPLQIPLISFNANLIWISDSLIMTYKLN